jgi:alpha-2-macroglobulin
MPRKADDLHSRRLAERARALVAATGGQPGQWQLEQQHHHRFTTARAFWAWSPHATPASPCTRIPRKTAAFLLKQLEGLDANDNDSKAIVLHALSTDKRADFAACNRLYRDRNTLGSATLAYLTRAFYNIDRKESPPSSPASSKARPRPNPASR